MGKTLNETICCESEHDQHSREMTPHNKALAIDIARRYTTVSGTRSQNNAHVSKFSSVSYTYVYVHIRIQYSASITFPGEHVIALERVSITSAGGALVGLLLCSEFLHHGEPRLRQYVSRLCR